MNRTLVERARTLLSHAGLPTQYWQFAIATAAHVTNRLPSNAIGRRSLYELWTGQIPDVSHLRIFGCRAYSHIPDQRRRKLDPKADVCIMLGYATEQKGYRLQDEATGKIITSRDVTFDEHLPRKPSTVHDTIESEGEKLPVPEKVLPIATQPTPTIVITPSLSPSLTDQGPPSKTVNPTASKSQQSQDDNVGIHKQSGPVASNGSRRRRSFSDMTRSAILKQRSSTRLTNKPARLEHEHEDEQARRMAKRTDTKHTALSIEDPTSYEESIEKTNSFGSKQ